MSITPNLVQLIRAEAAQLAERRKSDPKFDEQFLAQAASKICAAIPGKIALAMADGACHVEVMALVEGRDYTCPTWKDRAFSKGPKINWLKGTALAVFVKCQADGLEPLVSEYRGSRQGAAAIVITWDLNRMSSVLGGNDSFMEKLQAVTAEGQARKAAESLAERSKTVREHIAEMHREINRVSKDGRTEAKAFSAYSGHKDSKLRGDSWTGDIITYAEQLGLKVRITTCEDHSRTWPGDTYRSDVYVSWKGAPPAAA